MEKAKTTNYRLKHIDTRLTLDEYNLLKSKAKFVGLSASEYIRRITLNYPTKSTVDQLALNQLINARADLGRLGGLFKIWLSKDTEKLLSMGDKSYESIEMLVMDIERKQGELLAIAKNLMKIKNGS